MKKTSFRIKQSLILTFILLLITSCTLIPCTSDSGLDYVNENPKPNFLIGTYKLDEWTLSKTQGYSNSQNSRLKVYSNGLFELINIPKGTIDINTLYYSEGEDIDANGTWKTRFKEGETAQFSVNFSSLSMVWKIYEQDEKAVILIRVGDPDNCAAVRFIKTSE
jgi:hypothetical protein